MNRRSPLALPIALCATALWLAPGCRIDNTYPLSEDFGQCVAAEADEDTADPGGDNDSPLRTYYQDVKPILDAKCAICHNQGGIGPFGLETYEEAFVARDISRDAITRGVMPPWQPDDCCNHYKWDLSLSADEERAVLDWIDQGALAGDPENPAPALDVDLGGLSRVDLTLTMPEPFTPKPIIGRDEVRCFVLDWPFEEDIFVTGVNVSPGDRSMVHHVIVYATDADNLDAIRKLEAEDERPGWDCYGSFGNEARPTAGLGGWTPGTRGIELPEGLGRRVPANSVIILNVHYDTGTTIAEDQTSVELMLADSIEKEVKGAPVGNPLWLVGETMLIPANEPDTMVFYSYDPTVILNDSKPIELISVNHHMHELGSIGRLAILRKDGSTECLLNITSWDFDWLGEYYFAEPVLFNPGDRLYIECHWDNTAGNQKFVDGEQETPRDISWGTDEEMCGGIVQFITVDLEEAQ